MRFTAYAEGLTYIVLLFVGVPLKYLLQKPQLVEILGPIHGVAFVAYCLMVINAHFQFGWKYSKTILALLLSLVPFGTLYVLKNERQSA